jgi:hypothetical protein
MKFLTNVRSFVEKVVALEKRLPWLGGLSNHPDVFRTLYPLLLGLCIFLEPSDIDMGIEPIDSNKQLMAELVGVAEISRPLVANPLIFNLLFKILKRFELQCNMELGSDLLQEHPHRCSVMEGFDPFFLLK